MGFSRASCVIFKESGPIVRRFANDARKVSGPFVRRYATDDARKNNIMVDGTRLRSLDERLGGQEVKLDEFYDCFNKNKEEMNQKLGGVNRSIEELKKLIMEMQRPPDPIKTTSQTKDGERPLSGVEIPENSGRTLKEPVVNEVPNNVNKVPFLTKVLVAASIIAPCVYFSN